MGACSAKVKDPHGKCAPEDMGTKHQPAARSLQSSASSRSSERDTGPLSDRSRLREKVRAGVSFSTKVSAIPKSPKTDAEVKEIREKLQTLTVLGALSSPQLEEMISYMSLKWITEKQDVSLANGLHIILEGSLVRRVRKGNAETEVRCGKGELLGELELLYERPGRSELLARTMEKTKVGHLSRDVYQKYMAGARGYNLTQNIRLISSVPAFANLSMTERARLADACKRKLYNKGEHIITEGHRGTEFFILVSGTVTVHRRSSSGDNPIVDNMYPGDLFGEAALLNDKPRNATIIATGHGTEVLCVDKANFIRLLGPARELLERPVGERNELMMVEVDMFRTLSPACRKQLLSRLTSEKFSEGEFVFHQGDDGDKMYIITSGEVEVLLDEQGESMRKIDHLYRGRCFGERALVKQEPRMAHIRALGALECFSLTKADFEELALAESAGAEWSTRWEKEETRDTTQLKVMKPLGSGAFGVAWLVQHKKFPERSYALKCLNKDSLRQRLWADVVIREKDILASLPMSPFVVTLYNTFQCPQNLYMLMEVASGGELYQRVADNERLSLGTARYYVACIVLAIEHLHKHFIVYRDLKPENLLVTRSGSLKLIDMGFARRMRAGEKAYTLCGTPYYLAPEMIQHLGHDMGLDWWSVGVLLFEMIEGLPPFLGNNEMEVYEKVLELNYRCSSRLFSPDAADLIGRFLCLDPSKRLGNLFYGAEDIKSHAWFANPSRASLSSSSPHPTLVPFDWEDLAAGRMQPPYTPPPERGEPRFDKKVPVAEPVLENVCHHRPSFSDPAMERWLDDWS